MPTRLILRHSYGAKNRRPETAEWRARRRESATGLCMFKGLHVPCTRRLHGLAVQPSHTVTHIVITSFRGAFPTLSVTTQAELDTGPRASPGSNGGPAGGAGARG